MFLFNPEIFMWLFLACQQTDKTTDTSVEDTAFVEPSTEADTATENDSGSEPGSYVRMTGSVTWTLTFDEEAQANGFESCSYRRSYEGEERVDHPYLCPDCEIMVQGIATMEEGGDCHAQISSNSTTQRTELWGMGNGEFFRSSHEQRALGALGTIENMQADTDINLFWSSENTLTDGGTMLLEASGTAQYSIDPSISPDPDTEPHQGVYACGWPQNNPENLTLDYNIDVGKTFPNVHLVDQCGDRLSLWDLYGNWLILDTTQSDCGPCRSMAAGSEEALANMRESGIDVMMVSFLGNGLSAPFETPDQSTFDNWVESYELQDPVLFDEGFAFALFPEFVENFSGEGFGYPTWLLVNPEMTLVYGNVGFGSWEDIQSAIEENQ
jgi:peroxiredoxin